MALSLTLAACADGPAGPVPSQADAVAAVELSHDTATLAVGGTLQLTAVLRTALGVVVQGPAVSWSSSDASRATVDVTGLVRGVAPGGALVIASSSGRADTARVTVTAAQAQRDEARALWVNRFEYMTGRGATEDQARIVEILEKTRQAGFNLVYFQVRGQGDAYYRSALEPCAIALCGQLGNGQPAWDPLEFAVREAHARGLQLHAWLNAFPGWASPTSNTAAYCALLRESAPGSPRHMLLAHPQWVMVGSNGQPMRCENSQASEYAYVSPGIPAVRTHLARVAADVARRYAVDGIHLDRVRYPGPAWSHDTVSLRVFGRDPAAGAAAWAQFRRDQVGLAVREVHDSIRAARPPAVLSAAVWGIYDPTPWGWPSSSGVGQYFQDPRAWAGGGYLDVAVPMTYFAINATYCSYTAANPDWACLLDDHLAGIQQPTGRHVYIGIAANRGAAEVERQIQLGRQKGVRGFSVYSYNAANAVPAGASENLFGALRRGAFAAPARVPAMEWK